MRELVVLGTARQVPTRRRNHNGYLLRCDDQGLLFDPLTPVCAGPGGKAGR